MTKNFVVIYTPESDVEAIFDNIDDVNNYVSERIGISNYDDYRVQLHYGENIYTNLLKVSVFNKYGTKIDIEKLMFGCPYEKILQLIDNKKITVNVVVDDV